MSNLRKVTFNMPSKTYEDIKELAWQQRRTVTSYLVDWAIEGLEKEQEKLKKLNELE